MKPAGILILCFYLLAGESFAQQPVLKDHPVVLNGSGGGGEVHWLSFEEAVSRNEKNPKKLLIDVYTQWCGWCKVMEAKTYHNPVIANYINENYYPVKLDAETRDTIFFIHHQADGKMVRNYFVYKPDMKANELAVSLLNNKMGYPSTIFMDGNYSLLSQAIQGYQEAPFMEMILHYFGDNAYKNVSWDDYQKTFKGTVK